MQNAEYHYIYDECSTLLCSATVSKFSETVQYIKNRHTFNSNVCAIIIAVYWILKCSQKKTNSIPKHRYDL